jgi:CDP-diacylglycerol---glycerol-3-phosphate 3-phosphatidyltransferase
MADLVASLILSGFVVIMAGGCALLSPGKPAARLDGLGGMLLPRRLMEVAYRLFDPVVRGLLALRVTANLVTALSLLPGLAAAVLAATGHFGLAALFAALAGLSDLLDGMLARRVGSPSDAGELFDAAVDRYVEYLLFAGLAVYFRASVVGLVLCLGAALGAFMVSYTTAKAEALGVPPPPGAMRRAERAVYVIAGLGLAPLWQRIVPAYGRELPVELALMLVAVVANVSAVRRLRRIAALVRAKPSSG